MNSSTIGSMKLLVITGFVTIALVVTGCTATTGLATDVASTQNGGVTIAAANKTTQDDILTSVAAKLEGTLATTGTYPASLDGIYGDANNPIGYSATPNGSGYLLMAKTADGSHGYRASGSTKVIWVDKFTPSELSNLVTIGVSVPEGLVTTPTLP